MQDCTWILIYSGKGKNQWRKAFVVATYYEERGTELNFSQARP